ncbi:hypothetical protein GPECTOR_4g972 [Gonium pectorale]|uniref:DUF1664 domain-containing protein n=1 Tax=Gonium pectorale TaxID=33097 RepID=A0A150GZZ4_GONPE|nr:hypothetical protein GPECTOR_4g972 [Gonium pectorale]|eukprot:KXZ54900.1 hypothetical protein GPECTOR_4g972 [Gonium pectorale]
MPSWPTALGGMFMAGYAATQAHKVGIDSPTALVGAAIKTLNTDGSSYAPSASGRGGGELSVLQSEVDRLHKLLSDVMRDKRGGQMVIHTGTRGGWSVFVLPCAVAGGAVYVYARVRGLSISDFFMVTGRSMQQFRELVSHSMTQLWEEMRKQKDEFLARISALGQQQQQMLAAQNQMDERLQNVSANVEDIRDISNTIEARVGQMDQTINIMSTGVQRANEGIYLLCAAVAEVTRRVGIDNSRLRTYVQSTPPEVTDGNPGLRTLLEGFGSGEQSVASISNQPSIVEVPEDGELAVSAGEGILSTMSVRSNGKQAGPLPDELKVLYRRESAPPPASRTGFGGLFGGVASANAAGNRSMRLATK